jgi:hypothetical protein
LTVGVAQRIDLMAAGDRKQIGAVGPVRLIGALDRGAPVGGAAHRGGQHPTDISSRDQILHVIANWHTPP